MNDKNMTTRLHQHADAAERARNAWTARIVGSTWAQAAEVAGFTDAGNCVRAVRNYFGALPEPERAEQRALWRERLELLWRQSGRDVRGQRPGAVRAAVALSQRAAQLDGLDEPSRSVVYTPSQEQIEEYLSTVVPRDAGAEAEVVEFVDGDE